MEIMHALASLHLHMSLKQNFDITKTRVCSKISEALTFTQPEIEARSIAKSHDEGLLISERVRGITEGAIFYI